MQTIGDGGGRESGHVANAFRYWAFISYSHRDERWAAWLHRKIEGYSGHAKLIDTGNLQGEPLPKRLFPIFRDRDELAGAPDLSERIQEALRESRYLIVVCSPNSAQSKWVNEEIKAYKSLGGEARVLAFIVGGEPNAGDDPQSTLPECFPQALKYRIGSNGTLTSERTEPIAADARKGKDGERNALLKLIAGILGVRFDDLRRRDQERAARRRNWITAGALTAAVVFLGIAGYAYNQQLIAEERSRVALSRQLAAQALNEVPSAVADGRQFDYARGLLLAAQALHTKPTNEARSVLLKTVLLSPYRVKFLWGHSTRVTSIAFAPQGNILATAGADGSIMLWDAATRQLLGPLPAAHKGSVTSLAFSARDKILASGGEDGTVQLWNVSSRQPLRDPLIGPQQAVKTIAFSPDGEKLASGGGGNIVWTGELFVWDLSIRGQPRSPTSNNGNAPHGRPIESVAFSPDGKTLVSASGDGILVLWDVARLEPQVKLEGHQFTSVAFAPDGKVLASGGYSRVGTRSIVKQPYGLILWDLPSGSPRGIASPQEVDGVGAVDIGPDSVLASGSPDGRVMLWRNLKEEKPTMLPLSGHKESITSVKFSPDGNSLASASADGTLILRDLQGGGPLIRVLEHVPSHKAAANNPFYNIQGLALSSDGKTLASQGPGGKVILWDVASGQPGRELIGVAAWDMSLAFTPDGKTVAAATPEEVNLWDAATGEPKARSIKHHGAMDVRSFSRDSRIMALKMPDHSILFWDIAGRRPMGTSLSGHKAALTDLAFSPDGKMLASGSEDGAVILWDVATQRSLRVPLVDHKGRVEHLSFSPDGKLLALAASQNLESTLTLWNLVGFDRADLLPRQQITLDKLIFSPDGKVLVAAAGKKGLLLWDVASHKPLGSLPVGHSESILPLGFSSDGDMLVSVGAKGSATLWDVTRRSEIGTVVIGHSQGIRSAVVDKDAKVMVSSSLWGSKLIAVDLDPASWAIYACQVANRNLTENEWRQFVGVELDYEPACAQGPMAKK